MMYDTTYGQMGFGWGFLPGFGFLIMFLFLVLFLGIIYWIVKSGNISNSNPKGILKRRLANGDITKKEYHSLLEEIEK